MTQPISNLRLSYNLRQLTEQEIDPNPIQQFRQWLSEAIQADILEPNAMTLATTCPDGTPSARIVLLKGVDEAGFTFFTNYTSRKGQELAANPQAALVFWWGALERQVRIEGQVEQVSNAETETYFASRPRESQLGAWASEQSEVITDRTVLDQRWQALDQDYADRPIPRPPHWGGYRVVPRAIEFWQGRPNRLHDRLRYQRQGETWLIERLAP